VRPEIKNREIGEYPGTVKICAFKYAQLFTSFISRRNFPTQEKLPQNLKVEQFTGCSGLFFR
jgi:hypothetical protein